MMNLALNAVDAAGKGGRVRLLLEPSGPSARIFVEDSGPGIPEALRGRIFEPFFTTKAAGSGLGLPIVSAIMTQHRGTISIDKSTLGGARFVLELPRSRWRPRAGTDDHVI